MLPISHRLKEKVHHHTDQLLTHNLLFNLKGRGMVNFYQVATYVINLEHLFYHNCKDILESTRRYADIPHVGEFFLSKYHEEKGHDAWARADWVKLSKREKFSREPALLDSMKDLTDFLNHTMMECPYKYLAYMYAAEYGTTILGPVWMKIMHEELGLKNNEVTSLTNHIELDGDHAEEVADVTEELQLSEDIHERMLTFMDELYVKYGAFFSELALVQEGIYGNDQKDFRKVSAAP